MIGIQSDSRSGVRRRSHRNGVAGEGATLRLVRSPPMSQLLLLAAYTMPARMILWRCGWATGKVGVAYQLNRGKLWQVRRRESHYLLRTNLTGKDPVQLWKFYIQLVEIEAAFRALKDDLGLRPIYHQPGQRIEPHTCIACAVTLAPDSAPSPGSPSGCSGDLSTRSPVLSGLAHPQRPQLRKSGRSACTAFAGFAGI